LSVICFVFIAVSRFGFLGSIDSNTGSPDLGWDTDQFPMDIKNCTSVMKVGGFNQVLYQIVYKPKRQGKKTKVVDPMRSQ